MAYEVTLETVGAVPMAAVAARAQFGELPRVIPASLDKVYAVLRAGEPGPLGCNTVLYRPGVDGRTMDLRVGVRLDRPFAGVGEVILAETPAGEAAHVVYLGDYGKMRPAHQAAQDWARQQGRGLTGVSWEVYGDWSEDPTELRTDIYYQLEGEAHG
ncbi:hypothetical protein [Phenylobacterium sp.]|uniref:hypothetical protein n=1 Tax=Phenylobacterium sp. TaxID=1871053 RepID=UPI0025E3E287|nr:hypothetical protein [Phenylobacterium sp.]